MSQARLAPIVIATCVFGLGLLQSGCRGCSEPTEPPKAAPAAAEEAPAPVAPSPAAATAVKAAEPAPAPVRYLGPQSQSAKGFKLTSGFANQKGEPVSQPNALETNTVYVTALTPDDRPVGKLDKFAGADVHGFLVARDLRQALYANASGAVAEGADARGLEFTPREGGDHAMMVVLAPSGGSDVHTISTPIVIKGALPEVMGPGVSGLSARSRTKGGDVELRSDSPAVAGQPVQLTTVDVDNAGAAKGVHQLPFAVIYNDQMGFGDVLQWDDKGQTTWRPTEPGTYLLLAPPEEGNVALTFKLDVAPPPQAAEATR